MTRVTEAMDHDSFDAARRSCLVVVHSTNAEVAMKQAQENHSRNTRVLVALPRVPYLYATRKPKTGS